MKDYISAKQASEKWNISQRQVLKLCEDGRVEGAEKLGYMWVIPEIAPKPVDMRTKRVRRVMRKELKPFLKWAGGKAQLLCHIDDFISSEKKHKYKRYVEPMVGGGALLFHVLTRNYFEELYICDINQELINCYQVIKDNVDELIQKLSIYQDKFLSLDKEHRKLYYYEMRERYNTLKLDGRTALKKASLFIFLNKTCFNGLYRVNKKGKYNVPMGDNNYPNICDSENLKNISSALERVTIFHGDYSTVKEFINKDTFVYIDPPYRPLTITTNFTSYTTDKFNDNDQIRLASFVREIDKTGAKILLSNSDPKNVNPNDNFFDDLYQGFNVHRVYANRVINSNAEHRGKITELLICNKD